jgi:hypothetical protein
MVDLTGNFKRNGRERVLSYTIRYTSLRFVIYAVDTYHRVEICMTYNRPTAQTHLWSSIVSAVGTRVDFGCPGPSTGGVK